MFGTCTRSWLFNLVGNISSKDTVQLKGTTIVVRQVVECPSTQMIVTLQAGVQILPPPFLPVYAHKVQASVSSYSYENNIQNSNGIVKGGLYCEEQLSSLSQTTWSSWGSTSRICGRQASLYPWSTGKSRLYLHSVQRLMAADSWINGSQFDATAICYLDEATVSRRSNLWYSAIINFSFCVQTHSPFI